MAFHYRAKLLFHARPTPKPSTIKAIVNNNVSLFMNNTIALIISKLSFSLLGIIRSEASQNFLSPLWWSKLLRFPFSFLVRSISSYSSFMLDRKNTQKSSSWAFAQPRNVCMSSFRFLRNNKPFLSFAFIVPQIGSFVDQASSFHSSIYNRVKTSGACWFN